MASTEELRIFAPFLKRRLTSSLHWYVNQSLTDMLEDFMEYDEGLDSVERQALLSQMADLPLNFDQTARQLAVTIIIETIQREIMRSKGLCMELITGLIRRMDQKRNVGGSEVSTLLLKDFELLIDHVFFKDSENEGDSGECRRARKGKSEKPIAEKLKEAIAYAKILIKLFKQGFLKNRIPILVVLNKLSLRKPNSFYANLLLYILREVGSSLVEETKRFSIGGGEMIRIWKKEDTPTIDNVLSRVENFYKYVPSQSESIVAVKKLVEDRRKKISVDSFSKEYPLLNVSDADDDDDDTNGSGGEFQFMKSQPATNSDSSVQDDDNPEQDATDKGSGDCSKDDYEASTSF